MHLPYFNIKNNEDAGIHNHLGVLLLRLGVLTQQSYSDYICIHILIPDPYNDNSYDMIYRNTDAD